MTDLFESPSIKKLPIKNSQQLVPVRRIYCVGQNYAAHAKEMGGIVEKKAPFFFIKHPEDIIASGSTLDYPAGTENLHFELELVAVIGQELFRANGEQAKSAIAGFTVGLDLTKRDFQQTLKSKSLPWALSKSFSGSAVLSDVNTEVDIEQLDKQSIVLKQNGEIKQSATLGDMARSVEELIVYLSSLDTLYPGDLIFTGTPSGVGAIQRGDTLTGTISSVGEISLTIR